jgi:hypothetical protein
MDIRRKWNAFVGWCLYYPLGGLKKIRYKAAVNSNSITDIWVFGGVSLKRAFYYNTYHEYLVRNATKALTKQVEGLRRARKPKEPTKQEKMEIINHWIGEKKDQNKA